MNASQLFVSGCACLIYGVVMTAIVHGPAIVLAIVLAIGKARRRRAFPRARAVRLGQ